MGACGCVCRGCFAGLGTSKPEKKREGRWVYHGGMPMLTDDPFEGGLPGYVGAIKVESMVFGRVALQVETWPDYRIGSMHWPSGRLLAQAIGERAWPDVLPSCEGLSVAELGSGPGLPALVCAKLGARSVALTDLVELVPLMDKNVDLNGLRGVCTCETLDWLDAASSPLAAANRGAQGPLDILLAADVVYVEEQEPLLGAMVALMAPGHTRLVLAYINRSPADRVYLNTRILPRLEDVRQCVLGTNTDPDLERTSHYGKDIELYVGRLKS